MSSTAFTSSAASLSLRRVRYQTDAADPSEGIVTQHDTASRMVTVLNTVDGSFWRGPENLIEIVA